MKTTFTRRFCAAHRIQDDPGVCSRIHGHNYTARISVMANVLGENNFIVPADYIKDVVDGMYDHRLILSVTDPLREVLPDNQVLPVDSSPSTEFLAQKIARDVREAAEVYLKERVGLTPSVTVTVDLEETPTISTFASSSAG